MSDLSAAPVRITIPLSNLQYTSGTQTVGNPYNQSGFIGEFNSQAGAGTLTYPLDTPKYIMTFTISKYVRQNLNQVGQFTDAGYPGIIMPLPQQLIDTNHVNWQELEVGTLPGTIVNGIAQVAHGQAAAGAGNIGAGALTAAALTLPGGAAASGIPGIQQVGELAAGGVNAAKAVIGFSPNQFVTLLMRGPTYKRHRFTWEVSPSNYPEADTLRQIITTFKNAMAPNFYQIAQGGGPILWQFPKIFWIRLYPNSMFMYKFKPCVCDYFVVNYMPGGRGAFYVNPDGTDGANPPEGLQIQANFIELEYWIEGNYGQNLGPGDNDPSNTNVNTPAGTLTNGISDLLDKSGIDLAEIQKQLDPFGLNNN